MSKRLSSSPCVLVSGKFGWSANMERLIIGLKSQNMFLDLKQFFIFIFNMRLMVFHCLFYRLMKAQALGDTASLEFMKGRRILEVNPDHPIIKDLNVRPFNSNIQCC